ITATGKTVEDAVASALKQLGATEDQVQIEIISRGSKGVLGIGSTEAQVKVTLLGKEDAVADGEQYLCEILNAMGVDEYDVEIKRDAESVTYNITSDGDVGFVIGYHGDVLDALSAIISLAVNRDADYRYHVNVDLNGYREKRVESLKDYAARAVDKANSSGYVTVANPMKPFERMILHTVVQENSDVVSWSEGEEPRRRVIIAPLSKVKKVGDKYERIDKRDNFRKRDDRRSSGYDRNDRGDRNDRNDRGNRGGGRGGNDGQRPIKPISTGDKITVGRPVRSDFAGGLYSKIEVDHPNTSSAADQSTDE
ncbi:MAG TPA: RNA-binding cell elongation regulator Jag/EloR, partial [Clostridiales bacterium]|nr:RNA-binding cell elongation regulator Jag/EloR [Clostridiales bacterium]